MWLNARVSRPRKLLGLNGVSGGGGRDREATIVRRGVTGRPGHACGPLKSDEKLQW